MYFKRKNIKNDPERHKKYPGVKGDEVQLPCYAEIGSSGWCGTCLRSAKPGQPGFCPEEKVVTEKVEDSEEVNEDEFPRPSAWGGWGFCDALCSQTNYQGFYWSNEPRLKEIRRMSAGHKECSEFYNMTNRLVKYDSEKFMSKLCVYQDRELDVKAYFR